MIVIVIYILLSTVTAPVQNLISRNFERQADQITLELTGDPQAMAGLFLNLAQTNYSNVEPHPLIRYLWYSHPPIMERIRRADNAY
ncbi:MAG: M48 family metalloprotease [Actinomycetota bacterium]|nr:M48 family metalloprotease [Actinomycetota bacterium]